MIPELLNHLWQSTVCVGVAGLLTLQLRHHSARVRYWLWFTASVKFLVPFFALVRLGQAIAPAHVATELLNSSGLTPALVTQSLTIPFAEPVPTSIERAIPWQALIIVIWAFGALLAVTSWSVRYWRMRLLIKTSKPLQMRMPIPVRSSPDVMEPGLIGIVHPVLLLPQGLVEQFSPGEVQSILAHELCHLRRRDNLTYAIHLISCAAFWFYPLLWWLGSRLIVERERACDEAVLASGHKAELYGGCILKVCRYYHMAPVVGTSGVSGADLGNRIRRIMTWRNAAALSVAQKALLTVTAGMVVSAPLLLGAARAMQPPTPGHAAAQQRHSETEEEQLRHTPFNPADFDNYAGYYQYADYRFYQFADFPIVARVYRDGARYYMQDTGQTPVELVPEGFDEMYGKFAARVGHKKYVFVMGPDSHAREMVTIRQGHVDDQAPRVSKADWDAAAAKLQKRIVAKMPSPGTETALRGQLAGWEKKQPDYTHIPYNTVSDAQEKPEQFQKMIDDLGPLTGLRFVKVNQRGWDVFDADFSRGAVEFSVAPVSPSGKLAGETYRLL
jgi:beta-lactamase regulating signal transducer with metallopeptidase domain